MSIKKNVKRIARRLTGPLYVKAHAFKQHRLRQPRLIAEIRKMEEGMQRAQGKPLMIHMGTTEHVNLGDLAQCYCIGRWIDRYCPEYVHLQVSASAIVEQEKLFFDTLQRHHRADDVLVFQSGYTTTDLGGYHDLMHRLVATHLPDARMLLMPQTILFVKKKNEQRTARVLNACKNLTFLARDRVSFAKAQEMFPDVRVLLYPDIVTSLIGSFQFQAKRDRIFLCRRNDGEKFYSDKELQALAARLQAFAPVEWGDTQSSATFAEVTADIRAHVEREIERYSHYKVTITDRYHGTIFSLCAGTPVVIIKTTDHKVTTGADWFKDVYEGYVSVADSLDDAYEKAKRILEEKKDYPMLTPHFEKEFYGEALKRKVFLDGQESQAGH